MAVALTGNGRDMAYVVSEALDCEGRAAQLSIDSGLPISAATTIEAMRRAPSKIAVKRRGNMLS